VRVSCDVHLCSLHSAHTNLTINLQLYTTAEIGLIMEIPRTAACVASSDSLLLEIDKHDFENFLLILPAAAKGRWRVLL
jgi:hypothetical protein